MKYQQSLCGNLQLGLTVIYYSSVPKLKAAFGLYSSAEKFEMLNFLVEIKQQKMKENAELFLEARLSIYLLLLPSPSAPIVLTLFFHLACLHDLFRLQTAP